MKFYSEYLKKDLEFVTIQETDAASGEPISIIPHESLLSIAKTENLNISQNVIYASPKEAVLACTISDNKGKSTTWIGESNEMTLDNEIKQKYRFTMAWNQAFDRALIIFLQLPDRRVKSDMEMSPSESGNLGPQMNGGNPYMNPDNQRKDNAGAGATSQTPKNNQTAVDNAGKAQNNERQASKVQQPKQPTPESDGKIIITIGKFRNNKTSTIKDIYETDFSWIKWMAESGKFDPKNNENDMRQYEAIIRYYQYRQALNQQQK